MDIGDYFMSKQRARQENTKASKIQKNLKKPQITHENIFPFFSRPVVSYARMFLIPILVHTSVKKTVKNSHPDLENGPRKSLFQSSIYGAFGRIVSYMK